MPTPYFYPSTTDPPALSADEDAAVQQENIPWMLLELLPYLAKCENATTACCDSWDGKEIQVTLCPRHPPCVSYLCVHSPGDDIQVEPEIIATEDDLIVLRVSFSSLKEILSDIDNLHYYVYQADDGSGRPSLKHLPRILPRCRSSFDATDMGVLRYDLAATKEYIVAGIVADVRRSRFTLYLYDSGQQGEEDCWTIHTVSLNHEHQLRYRWDDEDNFFHKNCKVMEDQMPPWHSWTSGGESSSVMSVNCNDIKLSVNKRETAKPSPYLALSGCQARWTRTRSLEATHVYGGTSLSLMVGSSTWSCSGIGQAGGPLPHLAGQQKAPTPWATVIVGSGTAMWTPTKRISAMTLKLLPRGGNYDGSTVPPFKKLHIRQPVLGLQEGADIIFFTAKVSRLSEDARVVTIDMRNKPLLGVAAFSASRTVCIDFDYIQSRTSKYLKKDPSSGTLSTGSSDAEPS